MGSIKIKDFFNGKFFEVPKYQRGYAWERQNIRDLFDDITESIDSNSNHYIGTIVLSKDRDDEDKHYVVDGQQRITTISMIISSIINHLEDEDKFFYKRFYIKDRNRFRLICLNRDNKFFIDLLDGNLNLLIPENKSQRALIAAINEINFKVKEIDNKLSFLQSIEKLEIMQFVENSEGDAIRIFQTVNDRGKPLSNMEKAKSLLIYFSNRYLAQELDSQINDIFSDIFEIYDDIKQLGSEINVNLIKSKDFDEDSLMRYHFITYSNDNYDPSSSYVLKHLKNELTKLRASSDGDYSNLKTYIIKYIDSIKLFFESTKSLILKANTQEKYYKLFSILQLSATLYPLTIKLEMMQKLQEVLLTKGNRVITAFDMIELIDVRVYKTRGTDPKADIARFTYEVESKSNKEILGWLMWFNNQWMPKHQFQSSLNSNIYGNRALNHIFISYCESVSKTSFSISDLKKITTDSDRIPSIEHILSQTPLFNPTALGFDDEKDYIDYEHKIGNLSLLERVLNSRVKNEVPIVKADTYGESYFVMTQKLGSDIHTLKGFTKKNIIERTSILSDYCNNNWWCETSTLLDDTEYSTLEEI
jgi:uncharacterized protein with ParB-like and HNH nuclease domain